MSPEMPFGLKPQERSWGLAAAFSRLLAVLLALCLAPAGVAQVIETIIGNAPKNLLVTPAGVGRDPSGVLYVVDSDTRAVYRVDPRTSAAAVIAGGGAQIDDSIPIAGTSAYLQPSTLAIGRDGSVYIVDQGSHRVRLLKPDGLLTTIIGNGTPGFSGDGGPATRAQLNLPLALALDSSGNIYFSDRGNRAIRRVDARSGVITTIAGGPAAQQAGDGVPAVAARLNFPWDVAVDSAGNVFFADTGDQVVRKIEAAGGLIRTAAGNWIQASTGDGGPATAASLTAPRGLVVAPDGDLYISEYSDSKTRLRKVSAATGIITTVLGRGDALGLLGHTDAAIQQAIAHIAFAPPSYILIPLSESNFAGIGQFDFATGLFTIIAGNPLFVGDGGPASAAAMTGPQKIALDAAGDLYIADFIHHRIRRVTPGANGVGTGTITTVAGNGIPGSGAIAGPATSVTLSFPIGVFVDSRNNVYFTDSFSLVRRIDPAGMLRTVAGTTGGFSGDGGPATLAQLTTPRAITGDLAGNLYIADTGNSKIRMIDTAGNIRTFAGSGNGPEEFAYAGDSGPATQAKLNFPSDVLLDARDGLLIADVANHRIRRVSLSTSIITTVAGNGTAIYSGDGGPATMAGLPNPRGLARDAQGNLYVCSDNMVRRIDAATGIISTVAGTNAEGFSGDGGLAAFARLTHPASLLIDPAGNLIVADTENDRIRRVSGQAVTPVLSVTPSALSFTAIEGGMSQVGQMVQVVTENLVSTLWMASVRVDSGLGWLGLRPNAGITPGVLQVVVNPVGLPPGDYTGSVTIIGMRAAKSPQVLSVSLTVKTAGPPRLAIEPETLTLRATLGDTQPAVHTIQVQNAGGGLLGWHASARTSNGGDWLTVSPAAGIGAGTLTVSATESTPAAGVYQGEVVLGNPAANEARTIPVVYVVSQPTASLALSQTGVLLSATEGATFTPVETVQVMNTGKAAMTWRVDTSSLSSANWLQVSPASGTTAAGAAGTLQLSASPAGLRAGVYDAMVAVTAPGAVNSPQVVLARLIVQGAGANPQAGVVPAALSLVARSGGAAVQQPLAISTSGGTLLSYVAAANSVNGSGWLSVAPPGGTLLGSAEQAAIDVRADPGRLAAGSYRGIVSVSFNTGKTVDAPVLLVVLPSGGGSTGGSAPASARAAPLADGACVPQAQYPLQLTLVNNFGLPGGWATPLMVRVIDNCGGLVGNSTVVASFSNGDSPLVLRTLGNGSYAGMWNPGTSGKVTVTITASGSGLQTGRGEAITGSIATGAAALATPLIFRDGAVNAASFARFAPLSAGQIFSVFGANLASQPVRAQTTPLPLSLGGVAAKLAGQDLPLYYADAGQINAQIPFELSPGVTVPLVVIAGGKASPPELITIARSQPGIFTVGSGGNAGVVTDAGGNLINPSNPAHPGDVVIVYSTGLGPINPPVATGRAAPADPPARLIDPLDAYVGGLPAQVEFAGLAPGFVGLCQVNIRIPANSLLGDAVDLRLEQNGISSNKVALAIRAR